MSKSKENNLKLHEKSHSFDDFEIDMSNEIEPFIIFDYSIRSPQTKDSYFRRLRTFFEYSKIEGKTLRDKCNRFAEKGRINNTWAFKLILEFLQMQRQRVARKEITSGTLRNYQKTIKSFCEATDVLIQWKKVTRGLPRGKRFSDDRAPTLEEIQKITEYPDRRIKPIVYVMASSGIRVGAWDYLKWGHITPINDQDDNSVIIAAKIRVYADEDDEYSTFISSEAYRALKDWMDFRRLNGEDITNQSWVMRNLWNTERSERLDSKNKSGITNPIKLSSIGIKRLMERALWTQNLRVKSDPKNKRYAFQTDHGFRKFFKTRCEIGGMKSINIEKLMGHSIGISDSYYRATERELLEDYLKVEDLLSIDNENKLQKQLKEYAEKNNEETFIIKGKLQEKDEEIKSLTDQFSSIKNMIENLVKDISENKDQEQVNKFTKTLFSSGLVKKIDS